MSTKIEMEFLQNNIGTLLNEIEFNIHQITEDDTRNVYQAKYQILKDNILLVKTKENQLRAIDLLTKLRDSIRSINDNECATLILDVVTQWNASQIIAKYEDYIFSNCYCKRIAVVHGKTIYKKNETIQKECLKRLSDELIKIVSAIDNIKKFETNDSFQTKLNEIPNNYDKQKLQSLIKYTKANVASRLTLFIKGILLAQVARVKDKPTRPLIRPSFFQGIVQNVAVARCIAKIFRLNIEPFISATTEEEKVKQTAQMKTILKNTTKELYSIISNQQ